MKKSLTDRLLEVADVLEQMGIELDADDIVCMSVFTDFVVLHVSPTGIAKVTAKLGLPVRDNNGRLAWVNPAVERQPWMSEDSFRWASKRWLGNLEIVAQLDPWRKVFGFGRSSIHEPW